MANNAVAPSRNNESQAEARVLARHVSRLDVAALKQAIAWVERAQRELNGDDVSDADVRRARGVLRDFAATQERVQEQTVAVIENAGQSLPHRGIR